MKSVFTDLTYKDTAVSFESCISVMTAISATQPSPEDTRSSCPRSFGFRVSTTVAELSRLSCRSKSRIYKIVAGVKQKFNHLCGFCLLTQHLQLFFKRSAGLDLGLGVVSF